MITPPFQDSARLVWAIQENETNLTALTANDADGMLYF